MHCPKCGCDKFIYIDKKLECFNFDCGYVIIDINQNFDKESLTLLDNVLQSFTKVHFANNEYKQGSMHFVNGVDIDENELKNYTEYFVEGYQKEKQNADNFNKIKILKEKLKNKISDFNNLYDDICKINLGFFSFINIKKKIQHLKEKWYKSRNL